MDDDILSQGGDREPSPWPRRLGVIALLVLVAVAGIGYLSLPRHQQAASAPVASPTPTPSGRVTTTGRLTAVPGTWASSDALAGFGWPADSDSLVAEFNFTATLQLTSWRPGASRLAVTVIKPGPTQASLIVG